MQARALAAADRWRDLAPRTLAIEGTLAALTHGDGAWRAELDAVAAVSADAPPAPPRLRLRGDPGAAPAPGAFDAALPGSRVRARVRLAPVRPLRNPGAADRAQSARREGIGAVGRLAHPGLHVRVRGRSERPARIALERQRRRLSGRWHAAGSGSGLMAALALGDRSGLEADDRLAFRRLGASHLLAVSGLHVALAAGLAWAAARVLATRVPRLATRTDARALALLAACLAGAAYAGLAGWGLPVRRALCLLLALALGFARRRPTAPLAPLWLAALLVLAFEPSALFAPGAQLSFAASAGLLGARSIAAGARRGGRTPLLASAVALAVTAPLAALHFGSRAPLALPANLVLVPWTGVVLLPGALLATLAAAFELPGADLALVLASRLGAATLAVARTAAAHVPAMVDAPTPAGTWLLAAAGLALAALRTRRAALRIGCALGVSLLLQLAPPSAPAPKVPRWVQLDVGQGDAALVQGMRGAVLIDAGVALSGGPDLGRTTVVPALRALGVSHLDLVVASHADLDHRGGLPAVLDAIPVDAVWLPRGRRGDPGFAPLLAAAGRAAVPVHERGADDPALRAGDLVVTPLWPMDGAAATSNDASLVVRVEVGGRRVLFTGDLGAAAEADLIRGGADLRATGLKLPHHGSRSSSSPALLAAVGPEVAVASAPCAGRWPMPHPEVAERVQRTGAALWWTGRDGAVSLRLGSRLIAHGVGPARRCPGWGGVRR